MKPTGSQQRVARMWRGRTTRDRADEYQDYLLGNGIAPLQKKGALAVQMFREDRETETEFFTISYWESIEAMEKVAGNDPTAVHHLERDPEYLVELPRRVQILQILDARGIAIETRDRG